MANTPFFARFLEPNEGIERETTAGTGLIGAEAGDPPKKPKPTDYINDYPDPTRKYPCDCPGY